MGNYRELWKTAAVETGGRYVEHGRLPKMPRIIWDDDDREIVVEVFQSMQDLDTRGKAVLMVSSYLPELLGVCDRIAVMHRGRLGPARPTAELSEHGVLKEATGA